MARNVGGFDAAEGVREISVGEVLRCVVLQMATLAGLLVALVSASLFVENCRTGNDRDLFAEFETNPTRRWLIQFAVGLGGLFLASICVASVVMVLFVAEPLLRGHGVAMSLDGWTSLIESCLYALPVWLLFVAGSICLARAVRSGPVAAIGIGVVVTMNLLVIQHLIPSSLERMVPTAWVGQWQRLTGDDYGIAYFWTVGTFQGGRGVSGLLVLASLLTACVIGIRLTRARS